MGNSRWIWAPGMMLTLIAVQPGAALAGDEAVKVSSAGAVKGTQAVVIGAFNVGFIFQSVDNSKATGGMIGAFGGVTKARSVLDGVTPTMMQAITDAAYADFKAQLEAGGFAVADPVPMFATPEFQKVKAVPAPYDASLQLDKNSTGKASYYKPAALPAQVMLPGDIIASGFGGMGLAMSMGTNQYAVSQYARASGQAVIDVVYLIDFSNEKRPGAFSFDGLSVSSGMSVVDDYSKVNLVTPQGKLASVTLKRPVAVMGDFATMADTTRDAGVQQAANIVGGLMAARGFGGMKFGKTRTYTFTARAGVYEQGAIKATTLANRVLVDQLVALK